jgi:hypothetical protein
VPSIRSLERSVNQPFGFPTLIRGPDRYRLLRCQEMPAGFADEGCGTKWCNSMPVKFSHVLELICLQRCGGVCSCFMSDVTRILDAIAHGDPNAANQLLPSVYEELRKLAAQKLAKEKPDRSEADHLALPVRRSAESTHARPPLCGNAGPVSLKSRAAPVSHGWRWQELSRCRRPR